MPFKLARPNPVQVTQESSPLPLRLKMLPQKQRYLKQSLPSTADGVNNPNRDGFWFLVPWRAGFNGQPQAQQYIILGDSAQLNVQTTGGPIIWPSSARITVNHWSLKSDNTWLKSPAQRSKVTQQSMASTTQLTRLVVYPLVCITPKWP